jgi:poly-gamma-glutamate synthesis protein (capsule biosynthesis protein)
MLKMTLVGMSVLVVGVCLGAGLQIFNKHQPRKQRIITTVAGLPTIVPSPTSATITLMAVGDVMLSRSVLEQVEKRKSFTWPFEATAERLREVDLTIGNLETPLAPACPPMTNRMVFCAPQKTVEGLTYAGFDLVSLENNHATNTGIRGREVTEGILQTVGIAGVRDGEVEIKTIKGVRLGFMGMDALSRPFNSELVTQVASAAATVDVLVGIAHWGTEYTHEPLPHQKEWGHKLVDAGVKVIIGSHPHWTQPVEEYHGGLIFYSLGNFVFDQMWSEETRLGEAAEIKFQIVDGRVKDITYGLLPVKIYDYGQPRWEGV